MGNGSRRRHTPSAVAPAPTGPASELQSSVGEEILGVPAERDLEGPELEVSGAGEFAPGPRVGRQPRHRVAVGVGAGVGGGRAGGSGIGEVEPDVGDSVSGLPRLAGVPGDASGDLADVHAGSEAAQEAARREPPGPATSWSDDPAAFQAAYQEAQERLRRGEGAVPLMTENATGGLGARDGGRGFGVEIEFDFPAAMGYTERQTALQAIGRELHAAGLTSSPLQRGYHSRPSDSLAGHWRFESDSTVAGEIISPVVYDEPQTWRQLAQVCDVVRRHGGVASARTGGHVHVGVGDFDHTVQNHNNLLALFHAHEDVLYRLAQNPGRPRHRGLSWCAPNRVAAAPYPDTNTVHYANNSHGLGMNFQSVTGRSSDHVEFRMWDSSLDPGVIQAQVKLSLGLAHTAFRSMGERWGDREPIGAHRERNAARGRGRRLTGEAWQADTSSFRRLVDRVLSRDEDKAQATALFAGTRWQRGSRR